MKTNPKLTTWFTNGEKPAYPGVYNVSCRKENQTGEWYSYWNGYEFTWFEHSVDAAYRERLIPGAGRIVLTEGSWRGLAEKPE